MMKKSQSIQSSRTDLRNFDEEIEKLKENELKNNVKLEFIFHEILSRAG